MYLLHVNICVIGGKLARISMLEKLENHIHFSVLGLKKAGF